MANGRNSAATYLFPLPAYYLSSVLVFAGVCFGLAVLPVGIQSEAWKAEFDKERTIVDGHMAWDGFWYLRIATHSYSYDPHQESSVAFFPAYPVLARTMHLVTGIRVQTCLLVVSHAALFGTFLLIPFYLAERFKDGSGELSERLLVVFGLFPTTFFFRMAYTEALFVLLLVLTLYGMEKRWPIVVLAIIAGTATATRGTGMALLPLVAWHVWTRSRSACSFAWKSVLVMPLACWGIIAYMTYLYMQFGDALAFSQTQQHWTLRLDPDLPDRIVALVTLEPIWSIYVPGSLAYWKEHELTKGHLVSLQFANPIYFVGTAVLVLIGAWKKWLNTNELILSAGLLLIPYITHSYRSGMMGHARYAAVVFPVYIVMARLLERCPPAVAYIVFAFCGFLLAMYSALFAAWYRMI